MNALQSRWPLIKGLVPVAFSLVCAALMILVALWKRDATDGSPVHTALEWSFQLLMVLVIVGISVAGLASRRPSRGGQAR